MKTKVISVHQSPMNAQRWLVKLECGHEQWVTSIRKPKIKTIRCQEHVKENHV